MHVEFEYTREDVVDATQRFLARSKVVRSWKTNGILWAAHVASICLLLSYSHEGCSNRTVGGA